MCITTEHIGLQVYCDLNGDSNIRDTVQLMTDRSECDQDMNMYRYLLWNLNYLLYSSWMHICVPVVCSLEQYYCGLHMTVWMTESNCAFEPSA